MPVLVFIDIADGEIKKSSFETITYAVEVAAMQNTDAIGVVIGNVSGDIAGQTGKYGLKRVLHISGPNFDQPVIQPYASSVVAAAEKENAEIIILPKSSLTDAMAPRIAIQFGAGVVTNAIQLPDNDFTIKRYIYTGKAFATVKLKSPKKVITVAKNAIQPKEKQEATKVEAFTPQLSESEFAVKVKGVEKATGDILLTEADIIVSGGRGMKGPENWNVLEDFAKVLGAATGCSKPVSDMGWRPHHEHVGQTGVKVSPNLYIALGISGAIQHLAGVNSSKVIVVVNKDPEAPFFKAADYGIVGDIFDVVPKLTEAAKNM